MNLSAAVKLLFNVKVAKEADKPTGCHNAADALKSVAGTLMCLVMFISLTNLQKLKLFV